MSPYLTCGDQYTVFDTPHGCRVGVLICYDCNLIENVRANALLGAEILLAPHQTGGCRTKNPHLMGVIDRQIWDNRAIDPEAIERELRGDKGRGWLMRWLPSRHTTMACSSSSAMAWAWTTTRFALAMR